VFEKYPEIIRAENSDLVYLGVASIVNSACNLNWGSKSSVQADLFKGYKLPARISLRAQNKNGSEAPSVRKNFRDLTKGELRQFLAEHNAMPPRQSRQVSEAQRFFNFISDYGTDDWTVAKCWGAAQAHAAATGP